MKKMIFLAASCGILLGACAKEESVPASHGLTFSLKAVDGFSTRAAELYSSDAIQAIEFAHVYVFKSTDGGASYKYHKTYDLSTEWTKGSNFVNHSITRAEMLEDGTYRFLAVGRDLESDYSVTTMTVGSTDYNAVVATMTAAAPQEIFSGYADEVIDSSMESVSILMTRRVAGVVGYFKNVPTTYGGKTVKNLRLTLSAGNTVFEITSNPFGAVPTPSPATEPAYNIFDLDLTTQGDANGDGFYDGTPDVGGVAKTEFSTLVGAYMVPAAFASGNTMTLQLLADDASVLNSWIVKNELGQPLYNIMPNHVYSLGRKLQTPSTHGGTPNDPSDDDNPLDLSKSQVLSVNINAGWNTVHGMTVE